MNPKAPQIHGTIKLHEHSNPIRPIVNWKDSPAYKLAKFITTKLKDNIHLPNTYVKNSIDLINNLNNLEVNEQIGCSFDIKNMYTNIPRKDAVNIIHRLLDNNHLIPTQEKHELKTLLNTTLGQNDIQHNNEYY
jgi:hypothetical protein